MQLNFTKMHGLGNDFIVIDSINEPIELSSQQIQFIANRKYGIGCDQVLQIDKTTNNEADFNYRIFNADGSNAGHCGNGARCVIKYLATYQNLLGTKIRLQIKDRIISGHQNDDGSVTVDMGYPTFEPEEIPFEHTLNSNNIYRLHIRGEIIECGVASVGNPHVLIKLNSLSQLDDTNHLVHIAQIIQKSVYFLDGVNVNFYVKITDTHLKLRTYERGCGFTEACGTGATATAAYAIKKSLVQNTVRMEMPGGDLMINWAGTSPIIMTGTATEVFIGQINLCI